MSASAWTAWEDLPTDKKLESLAAVMRTYGVANFSFKGMIIDMAPANPEPSAAPHVDAEQAKREQRQREDEILFASSEGYAR